MINVTCAIVIKETKVLVTQRSSTMKLPLKWEFPGGKIEANESSEQCIHRELKEELNIEIQILKSQDPVPYTYEHFTINLIPFIARYLSGKVVLTEHKEYRWLEKEELKSLDWAPADIPVLEKFLKLHHD